MNSKKFKDKFNKIMQKKDSESVRQYNMLMDLEDQIRSLVVKLFKEEVSQDIIRSPNGFIVKESAETKLNDIMVRAYQEVMNTDFVIGIDPRTETPSLAEDIVV